MWNDQHSMKTFISNSVAADVRRLAPLFRRAAASSRWLLPAMLCFAGSWSAAESISFNRDVRPILSDRCFACHGPDAKNQSSEFRLDTREHAVADLGDYFGIVAGRPEQSEVHRRIHSTDPDEQMPPPEHARGLSARERKLLDQWIAEGAHYDVHWAFKPLPAKIDPPTVEDSWSRNAIDRFVADARRKQRLQPNQPASREKWLRRVTFDLTGLPPTLSEIDDFLADESDQAHAKVVNRLLDSDACAERLTSEWLDVARYSDTYGYQRDDERFVWPWRDWVIKAFRRNMPYDEFITWQLAGDLLPNATREQILATTFNRLHSHKKEGGVALEEFRIENVADRTETVGTAFMGMTLVCTRCHDHKFDPMTMRDYYSLSSFFANVDERGLISYFTDAVPTPAMPLPSAEQEQALNAARQATQVAERALRQAESAGNKAFPDWLEQWQSGDQPIVLPSLVASLSFEDLQPASKEQSTNELGRPVAPEKMRTLTDAVKGRPRALSPVENRIVRGRHGQAIRLTGDDAVVLPGAGHFGRHQAFSVSLWINTPEITNRAVIYRRSRGWDDAGTIGYELTKEAGILSAKIVHFWPGDAICVETTEPLQTDRWYHIVVTYDGSSTAGGLKIIVNGKPVETTTVQDSLTRSITEWRQGYHDFAVGSRYRDRGFKDGRVDELRLFDRELAVVEARHLYHDVVLHRLRGREELAPWERNQLRQWFLRAHHPASAKARQQLAAARRKENAAMDAIPAITIMREQAKPRPAFILKRGIYDQRGEEVAADTPAFLPAMPRDAPRNRLGLARWLTSPEHPLTARVTVNRYWQMIFGKGLVRTPEDFGNQGQPPTHPELLDWLARDFIDHGWNLRHLLRQMVLSATYRQSAVVSAETRTRDLENVWFSRGPGQRLSAEMIRDNVLAVSGLLVRQIGGPPVKPYDVALAYTPLPVDEGDKLHRRSLYTFWKRTSPSPVMMTMNSSKREVCQLSRDVTSSPLQALVLLNGPQFTEAAQALAERLLKKHRHNIDALAAESFRLLTSRKPSSRELTILRRLYEEQRSEFRAAPDLATELIGKTASKAPERVAAATILVNSIMNLDESLTHQ